MPDLSITPSQVFPSTSNAIKGVSNSVILAGDVVALDNGGKLVQADANGASPTNTPVGIAVGSAPGIGQLVMYVASDNDLTLGTSANPVNGVPYFLSANPGKICTAADLVSGMQSALVGFGKTGGKLVVRIVSSGQTI